MSNQYLCTGLTVYFDTPFQNLTDIPHLASYQDLNTYIAQVPWSKVQLNGSWNFLTQRSFVNIDTTGKASESITGHASLQGVKFLSYFDTLLNNTCYALVTSVEYINDGVTRLNYLLHVPMMFLQGTNITRISNPYLLRSHLSSSAYSTYEESIQTNDDVLNVQSQYYTWENVFDLSGNNDYTVVICSNVRLDESFGSASDGVNMNMATGTIIDDIPSPQDIYLVSLNNFPNLMTALSPYPWIVQNLEKCIVLPSSVLTGLTSTPLTNISGVSKVTGGQSTPYDFSSLTLTKDNIKSYSNFSIDVDDCLIRQPYVSVELTTYSGDSIQLNPSYIYNTLQIVNLLVIGSFNKIAFIPQSYRSKTTQLTTGEFLNNALYWNDFSELQTLVNTTILEKASGAYTRNLENTRQLSGRLENITDPKASAQSRIQNAVSLFGNSISNLGSGNILGALTSGASTLLSASNQEWEYYRSQQASFQDMQINKPSLSSQSSSNTFNISNGLNNLWIKILSPSVSDCQKIERYHQLYGYQINQQIDGIDSVNNMTIMDFVQLTGGNIYVTSELNAPLQFIPSAYLEILKGVLEEGVRLWHTTTTNQNTNLFAQSLSGNVRIA